ncbi:MAG: peptide deformylase [Bacteroidales bacterium]|nr:peptide deformylase [Bacteroidales bacterium]
MKKLIFLMLVALLMSCMPRAFTPAERELILTSDSLMYVTQIHADSAVLRTPSVDLTTEELSSPELKVLMAKMLYTVKHPSQDGVGIAAPQVGIDKRVIWVQRFDKPGEPFECYLNAHLDSLGGIVSSGPEGCLSVPPMRGLVPRHSRVVVRYVVPESLEERTEVVEGFTAIIFQHECDHLDGTLYVDKADTVYYDAAWAEELAHFREK